MTPLRGSKPPVPPLWGSKLPAGCSLPPAADHLADLTQPLHREPIAVRAQTLQVMRQPKLIAQHFQRAIRLPQQRQALAGVPGVKQRFQQIVQTALDALAQDEAMIARELAG